VLTSPRGANFEFSFPIEASATNNQAEYLLFSKEFNYFEKSKLMLLKFLEILC